MRLSRFIISSPISLALRSRSGESTTRPSASLTICSSLPIETGRFSHARSRPFRTFCRSNFSRRPSFLMTMYGISSMRSYVVKRLSHFRHSRRRRMDSPSLLSRESTTLSFSKPQNGHFMDERRRRQTACNSIVTGDEEPLRHDDTGKCGVGCRCVLCRFAAGYFLWPIRRGLVGLGSYSMFQTRKSCLQPVSKLAVKSTSSNPGSVQDKREYLQSLHSRGTILLLYRPSLSANISSRFTHSERTASGVSTTRNQLQWSKAWPISSCHCFAPTM